MREASSGRLLCCSDVHGNARAFRRVLRQAGWRPGCDQLVLMGDYLDRGPDPRGVLELLRSLLRCPGVTALKGNHEQLLADYLAGRIPNVLYLENGGEPTLEAFAGDGDRLVSESHFLSSLPTYYETDDYIFVHAGLRPGRSLKAQSEDDLLWIRQPFIDDYRGKTVVFGHTPTFLLQNRWTIFEGADKLGIDTGVAYGGRLSLVVLPEKQVYQSPPDEQLLLEEDAN